MSWACEFDRTARRRETRTRYGDIEGAAWSRAVCESRDTGDDASLENLDFGVEPR